ncbi:cyclic di-GMP phosphodiesterase response regulator RpfG [Clostridium tepidiprofundi DSM 19306]|uniref:Cyclic di-GMP phosphodiesterase response regulator RpfG n=1 Tax=Clostridium tepidiprofundi DSM 19306 TaxID=1121338 RepID=A0A151AV99_9CLOT|nr:HD-GYP domain-containing protein [Clostridium tepidiprofundi]KYH31568.1 cyclic di-GMP phosphodiesterase response regulator RpfG [Clostridium tepidiprofundi DSM 19306]
MRLTLVSNLVGNEILAKNIITEDGKLLLKHGERVNQEHISNLKKYKIFFVYIEDEDLEDIYEDTYLNSLKETALKSMPDIFNNLLTGNTEFINEALVSVYELIDYISGEDTINTNLYEVKNYDNYTYIHCLDTCIMSTFLGARLHYDKENLRNLALAALFHDIGKTKISSSIINKKGLLTKNEFDIIKLHPFYSKEIISKIPSIPACVIDGVAQHHEKFDGTGYPFRISGNEISEYARLISICDVFTAVSSNRNYRNRFDPYEAYELILSSSSTYFDPKLVELFKNTFSVYPLGSCLKLSNGIEGFVVKQNPGFPDRPVLRVIYDINKHKITPYEINLLKNTNITVISVL